MVGSMDSLDLCTQTRITEKHIIPLDCWHDISLSNIWIPSHLLPNRSKPNNIRVPQGIYHTLEKKDPSKYSKSFSVYSFSDIENEQGEIFVSDSDGDNFGSESTSLENIHASSNTLPSVADHLCPQSISCNNDLKNSVKTNILNRNPINDDRLINPEENLIANTYLDKSRFLDIQAEKVRKVISSDENLMNERKNLESESRVCAKSISESVNTESQEETGGFENRFLQTLNQINKNTDSVISLKDILDDASDVKMKDFAFDFKKGDDPTLFCSHDKKEKKNKKNKKGKKKILNYIPLDKFLDTNTDANQDYYCDKYFQRILNEKQNSSSIESNVEFPDLAFKGYEFIHSDKRVKENELKSTNFACDFNKSDKVNKNENIVDVEDVKPRVTNTMYAKIVIENIPLDATKDDILVILCGYGEIKRFSLVPVKKFLAAYVEIDLICDIDWIIECLNGSEPFGASTEKLRCYKQ